jgi:hypothetical protein
MTKPISTRVHGIIDYTWSSAASSAAAQMEGATSTARLLRAAATAATGSSLLTKYESGAMHVLPMRAHLALDTILCSALIASPLFLPSSERRYAIVPMLFGAAGLMVAMLTETHSRVEEDEEFGIHGGGELSTVTEGDRDAYLRLE